MAEYQITSWRDLPSLVIAREGDDVTKVQLAPRLQEAIDEAAMRLGETGSDDYLAGWTRSEWLTGDGDPAELAATVSQRLESEWSDEQISRYLDSLG
ncbi:MAG: virulence factor [Actinomycetes bacterium]